MSLLKNETDCKWKETYSQTNQCSSSIFNAQKRWVTVRSYACEWGGALKNVLAFLTSSLLIHQCWTEFITLKMVNTGLAETLNALSNHLHTHKYISVIPWRGARLNKEVQISKTNKQTVQQHDWACPFFLSFLFY